MASFLGEFRDVLQKGEDLPSLPAVVFELYAALDDDLVSVDQIASIIERDPGLATRLLRLANSAAFNCGDPIGDLTGAVHLLGVRQVRALCIALSVTNMFQTRSGGLLGTDFWDHSAGVAVAARELGLCLGYHEIAAGELYVAGLLHDVG
ncbi:MAG: HDOD domain-containing protein, partial [Myxococcota bacterium]|nr:HDOD domain-containing protein [Myxococcota bacterium]